MVTIYTGPNMMENLEKFKKQQQLATQQISVSERERERQSKYQLVNSKTPAIRQPYH